MLHTPSVVSMGNPHATFWVEDDVNVYALDRFGPLLENIHLPERAQYRPSCRSLPTHIILRTWERGAGLNPRLRHGPCAGRVNAAAPSGPAARRQ